jgi:hypothetical protein
VLVERIVPALERKRSKGKERSRKKSAAKAERDAKPYMVEGTDIRDELKRCCGPKGLNRRGVPKLSVYRTNKLHTTGRAWHSGRIHLSMPVDCTRVGAVILLIHELAHHGLFWGKILDGVTETQDPGDRRTSHGPQFLQTMSVLARQVYGVDPSLDESAPYHDFHRNLRASLKVSAWYERTQAKADAVTRKMKPRKKAELAPNQFRIGSAMMEEIQCSSFDTIDTSTNPNDQDSRIGLDDWFYENAIGEVTRVLTIPNTKKDLEMAHIFKNEVEHARGLAWARPSRSRALDNLEMALRDFLGSM